MALVTSYYALIGTNTTRFITSYFRLKKGSFVGRHPTEVTTREPRVTRELLVKYLAGRRAEGASIIMISENSISKWYTLMLYTAVMTILNDRCFETNSRPRTWSRAGYM